MFLKIASHLSYKLISLITYKDDMISDGIENCLQYVGNFSNKSDCHVLYK